MIKVKLCVFGLLLYRGKDNRKLPLGSPNIRLNRSDWFIEVLLQYFTDNNLGTLITGCLTEV